MISPKMILAFLVAAQAAFLCSTFGHWISVGPIVALVMVVVLVRSGYKSAANPSAYKTKQEQPPRPALIVAGMGGLLVIALATRSSAFLNENPNYLFIVVDIFAHFFLMGTLLLWALRPMTGHLLMLFFGLALILLCGAAGGTTQSLAAQTTLGVVLCVGFLAASPIILSSQSRGKQVSASDSSRGDTVAARQRQRALIGTTIALTMITGAVANVTDRFLPAIRKDLQDRLESTIQATQPERIVGGMRYVRGSRLGSIREHLSLNPNAVVLTIFAKQRPGYLRGTVFDVYEDNRWSSTADHRLTQKKNDRSLHDRSINPSGPALTTLRSSHGEQLKRFELTPPGTLDVAKFEIVGDPMRGNQTFLPLSTRWIEARSRQLTVNHHGIIRLGVDISRPYVAGAQSHPPDETLSANRRKIMTYLSPPSQTKLNRFANEIFQGFDTTDQKAAAIRNHFQNHFQYGLSSPQHPSSADRLTYFLEHRHEAHCEYFASATVLLLRSAGVPARYVTGYVSDEEGSEPHQWVAKNGDAHAWAEAYSDKTKQWFVVESTPGRHYQAVTPPGASGASPRSGDLSDSEEFDGAENVFVRWWRALYSFRAADTLFFLFRYSQIAVLIGLSFWLMRRVRRKGESQEDLEERRSREMLAKVDRLCRKQGLIREKSESLYCFADRVDHQLDLLSTQHPATKPREVMNWVAPWLRSFADARYQGKMPSGFFKSSSEGV